MGPYRDRATRLHYSMFFCCEQGTEQIRGDARTIEDRHRPHKVKARVNVGQAPDGTLRSGRVGACWLGTARGERLANGLLGPTP